MAKLKLKSRSSNRKIIILIACVVLALVIGATATILLVQEQNHGEQISHINISSMPNDREYYLDEELDITGLSVQVVLNNGSYYFVSADEVTVTGFDSSKVKEDLVLTVRYQGFTDTFTVSVEAFPKPKPTLVYIEVKDYKATYTWAEWQSNWINLDGTYIECHYSDDSTYRVTLTTARITDGLEGIDGPGTYTLTVYYDEYESGVFCTTTFTIKITN